MSETDDAPDAETVEKDWDARGFSCDLWVNPPDGVWKDYVHDTDELIMVLEGKLEVVLPEETIQLAVGEECLVPQGVLHTVRSKGGEATKWLYGFAREYAYTD